MSAHQDAIEAPWADARLPGSALDLLPDPVLVLDGSMRLVHANRPAEEFFGQPLTDWLGRAPLALVHPDDVSHVVSSFAEVQGKHRGSAIEIRVATPTGWRLVEAIGTTSRTAAGTVVTIALRDLTERRRWEVASGRPERFQSLLQHAGAIVMLLDGGYRIDSVSLAVTRQLGHDPSRVEGTRLADLVAEDDRPAVVVALDALTPGHSALFEADLLRVDGERVPFQFAVSDLRDDPVVAGIVVSATDISQRRALERRLTDLASRDPLTGLANRSTLQLWLTARSRRRPASAGTLAVLFVDLDRFKPVNDLHGHEAGDAVLVALAGRLRASVRPDDLVARLGGDEFVVVADALGGRVAAEQLARRLEDVLAEPVPIAGGTVRVTASVGVVTRDGADTGESPESLLAEADAAMFATKLRRRGVAVPAMLSVGQRRKIAEELFQALSGDPGSAGLRLYAMPLVDLRSGHVVGVETLLRWQHPRLGLLTPDRFLPIACDAGLDLVVGSFVLESAITRWKPWADRLPEGVTVNLSAGQLGDPGLPELVTSLLQRTGFPPRSLVLDIAEPALVDRSGDRRDGVAGVERLAGAGVRLAVDDFGTGVSSLSTVRDLPFDLLKVDRSIIESLDTDRTARGITEGVVALGHAVGMRVVAEGVERGSQHDLLRSLGVDLAQGHLYGRAMPPERFTGRLPADATPAH